ncbi:noncanonical pyrimidine nucleotidase, YjjG family protein [Patiriisocius marinistellae]|uniref:Noncanonical pyrimidine nucleotidase, YjjG family protein n=1 Tax=Patiriisocius marinistellae TaxID=2494560 RepID=A0A5J4FZY2_9FLAO|nr:YjjG family noncanonical pyrimidine nucleotidase [Patiriisocius marinistellae]GEQ85615.1 noncanonical pyrimidine nucleotidase, YjjG family protein [Patiriisocius marinistellae]
MKNKIKDVYFDLDHTLWDFDRNSALAFERVFSANNIEVPVTEFMKIYEPINFAYWKEYREERVTKEVLRRGRLQDTFEKLSLTYGLEIIDALSDGYIDELPGNNYLFDGAIELLEYLKNKYTLHIITNGFAEVQNIKMERSNLAPYFKTITSSEEVGVKKPNPIVFHTALEKTNAAPETSIMIGDTFDADILGAESVGMDTIFYNYRNEVIPSTYKVVNTLLEIKKHL